MSNKNEDQNQSSNALTKLISGVVGALFVMIVSLNCYTIVSTNSQASVESFGKVHDGTILEGFNLVAPW